jgi:hypothetical protein
LKFTLKNPSLVDKLLIYETWNGTNLPLIGNNKANLLLSVFTNNLFLFAHKITFQHPGSGRMMTLRATVPDFMLPIMKFLEFKMP